MRNVILIESIEIFATVIRYTMQFVQGWNEIFSPMCNLSMNDRNRGEIKFISNYVTRVAPSIKRLLSLNYQPACEIFFEGKIEGKNRWNYLIVFSIRILALDLESLCPTEERIKPINYIFIPCWMHPMAVPVRDDLHRTKKGRVANCRA